MLVPVQGGLATLGKRNRSIHQQEAALATVEIPKVYIFNIWKRQWRNRSAAGKSYNIPACPANREYSEPIAVPSLCPSEIDLADGGNNMGVIMDAGINGVRKLPDGTEFQVFGVANDIVGTNSSSSALDLFTTNLEWFGVFISRTPVPSDEEVLAAHDKLRQMMELIYATGAEKVQSGEKVNMLDRPRYNEAAEYLRVKPLWGSLDHTRGSCPECQEDIIDGATFCKHCQQAIDPASVAARAKKREKANADLAAS